MPILIAFGLTWPEIEPELVIVSNQKSIIGLCCFDVVNLSNSYHDLSKK